MSLSFSGVGSGLPISDWIEALMSVERQPVDKLYTQKSTYQTAKTTLSTVESKFSSLRSAIEKLTDANMSSSFDLFDKKTATSSDTGIATATASNRASTQDITLKVNSLASATTATSTGTNPGAIVDGTTKITQLGNNSGTTGKFSLFVNNQKYEFTVDSSSSLQSVANAINTQFGSTESEKHQLYASISNGKLKIDVNNETGDYQVTDFRMGANSDTSNFLNVTQLKKYAVDSGSSTTPNNIDYIESDNALTSLNVAGTVTGTGATSNLSQVVEEDSTFKIGEASFTISDTISLSDLIASINRDEDAGVVAQLDARSNKLILTSKDPGATTINLEDTSGNFLQTMGLVTSDGKLISGSQTLGQNASIELNGVAMEANSNTLTSDITGITGLTINLKGTVATTTNGTNTIKINIQQNTDQLTSAVSDLITKFNAMQDEVSTDTSSSGALHSEYSLGRLKSDLRSTFTSAVTGLSEYDNLAMIGITSGSVGTSAKVSTNSLSFDKDAFLEALSENPSDVKALLIGDKTRGITGILQQLETKVEKSLDPSDGYFATKEDSYDTLISSLNKSIERSEDRLTEKKEQLTEQFTKMDQLIAEMQSQLSALDL